MSYRTKYPPGAPDEPKNSCPSFDEAIKEIELAREINSSLRHCVGEWRKIAEWHEAAGDDLRQEVEDLKEELERLQEQLKDAEKRAEAVQ